MSNDPNGTPSEQQPNPPATPERRRTIKIGSQREDDKFSRPARFGEGPTAATGESSKPAQRPPAPQKPAEQEPVPSPQETAPAQPAAPAPEAPASDSSEVHSSASVASDTPKPDAPATSAASAEPSSAPPQLPPVPPIAPTSLPGDLEAEVAAALEGVSLNENSLEEMLTADTGSVDEIIEPESRRQATVVKIHGDDVFCTMGARHEGLVSLRQFREPPQVGDVLSVIVNRFHAEDGLYDLSVPGASANVEDWTDVDEGLLVEAHITGENKGGLECRVGAIRGFIPAGQVALYHVESFEDFVGQKLQCVVMEANPDRRNLVLSRRAAIEREREDARSRLLEELQVGQVREGVVSRLHDFGAFVDLGGIDGLIHVSQLSWDRVDHPRDVLTEGERVRVKIDRIDSETGKISLSYRDLLENPWQQAESKYPIGSVVEGTVTRLAAFGAFVKLESGIEGLIHISELAHQRITRASQVVQEDQKVQVKVLSVDTQAQRMSLSLKAATATAEADESPDDAPPHRSTVKRKHTGPLKGGLERIGDGDQFGLKW